MDLPKPESRREIFAIHLRKRKQDPQRFDTEALAGATEGFSGAEMEQAVIGGLYTAFSCNAPLTTEMLLREVSATRPLSRTMRERLEDLRSWAAERTVGAD